MDRGSRSDNRQDPLPAAFLEVYKKHGPEPYKEGEVVPVYNKGIFRNPQDGPMKSGDLVILYFEDESMDYLYLRPENFAKHSGKFGDFDHRDFVGKEFGEKIFSRTNKVGRRGKQSSEKGWLYALCPTPELWTEGLPHRTQIVQTSDQAVICFQLSLWDGKVVIDASNPVGWSGGPVHTPPEGYTSGAARLQALMPDARVVKAFNTFGAEHSVLTADAERPLDHLFAGDDADATAMVAELLKSLNMRPLDLGPLRNAATLEHLAVTWIHLAMPGGMGRRIQLAVVDL